MFNILKPLESADWSRPTIRVGRREIGPVGTALKSNHCVLLTSKGDVSISDELT